MRSTRLCLNSAETTALVTNCVVEKKNLTTHKIATSNNKDLMKFKAQISFVALFNEVARTNLKSIVVAAIEATEIQTSKSLFGFFFFFFFKTNFL